MAVTLGTSAGFVTTAPSTDPLGSNSGALANACIVTKDVLPSGTWKITEIGVWQDVANNSQCDFNVGIYTHNSGANKPNALVATQSSGLYIAASTAGWAKYSGLAIILTGDGSTPHWLAAGFQNVATDCRANHGASTGARQGNNTITGPTILDPWGATGEAFQDDNVYAIYALYEAYSSGLKIPVAQSIYRRRR